MKRSLAVLLALALLFALPIAASEAAANGEMLITSEKVTGKVNDVVTVDFYLYPNLPDGQKLESLSCTLKYDPELLTLGSISYIIPEENLTTCLKGNCPIYRDYEDKENNKGVVLFAFADAFGVEQGGFWFRAEFRIEKEGSSSFQFLGIEYSGLDGENHSVPYTLSDQKSVGGVSTPTPTTTPTPTNKPTTKPTSGNTTPTPAATATPTAATNATPSSQSTNTTAPSDTPAPQTTAVPTATSDNGSGSNETGSAAPTDALVIVVQETATPGSGEGQENVPKPDETPDSDATKLQTEEPSSILDILVIAGIILGIVALAALCFILFVLFKKRRKEDE